MIDFLLGCLIGLVLALTGAGGGILATPALVFGAGLDTLQAAPIALLAVGMSAAVGAVIGLRAGIVRYRAALLAAACGAVMTPLGSYLARLAGNRALTVVFALVLAYVALRMLRQAARPNTTTQTAALAPPCLCDALTGRLVWTAPCLRALLATGAAAGICAGMLGVGGGFVIVPAMQRATSLRLDAIIATSLAVIALVALASVATSAASGTLDWPIALPFAGGAVAGMLSGRMIAARWKGTGQQQCFGWLALAVAVALVVRELY